MSKVPDLEFNGGIYDNVIYTIGASPIIRLSSFTKDVCLSGDILAKCEFYNPPNSVKDQIGLAMIETAENDGKIKSEATFLKPITGNTGIALAFFLCSKRLSLNSENTSKQVDCVA